MLANLEYYAEYGEDRFLNETLDLPRLGVFVDVGAADGVSRSNTYTFEKAGWDGLCIEADPRSVASLVQTRKHCFCGAICEYTGITPFNLSAQDPALSSINNSQKEDKVITVGCAPLEAVLMSSLGSQVIDLLSVDVEGAEIEVLDSLDWDLRCPWIVIVEYNTAGLPSAEDALKMYFRSKPYDLIHKTQSNLIFKHQ